MRTRRRSFILSILAVFTVLSGVDWNARGDDWPHWRGPKRNGISSERGWLDHWPVDGQLILWKAEIGSGYSSFTVAKGRVCTMGNSGDTDTVFCFDALTGKLLWKHSYPADLGDKFFDGGTTGTPEMDGERVFTLSRWGDLFCFDATTGKIIWSRNIQKETGARVPTWGFAGSPTVFESLLLLNIGETGMALDKFTGKAVWQSANKDAGYSTPLPWRYKEQWLALFSSSQTYAAVELRTGKEQWRIRWLTEFGVNAADPIVNGEQVFISTGYGKGAVLLKPGVGVDPEILWKNKILRTQRNPAVLLSGFLYGIDGDTADKGKLKCVEIATGNEKWVDSEPGSGALIAADNKLIVLTDHGELMVAPASPDKFKPTARAQILGGACWTTPVLANGLIYARNSRGDMVCIDVQGKP